MRQSTRFLAEFHTFSASSRTRTRFPRAPGIRAVTCSVTASPEACRKMDFWEIASRTCFHMQRHAWYVVHVMRQSSELVCCWRSTGNLDSVGDDSFPTAPCIRQPQVRWFVVLCVKSTGLRISLGDYFWKLSAHSVVLGSTLGASPSHFFHVFSVEPLVSGSHLFRAYFAQGVQEIDFLGSGATDLFPFSAPCLVFWGTCFASVHGAPRESRPPDPEVHPRPSLQSCDFIAFAGVFNAPEHLFGVALARGADEKLEFLGDDFIWFSGRRLFTY